MAIGPAVDFMHLYFDLRGAIASSGEFLPAGSLHREILIPAMPALRKEIAGLTRYATPFPAPQEDLWLLYALSRVNDLLLLAFQAQGPTAPESPGMAEWLSYVARAVDESLVAYPRVTLSPEEYLAFFEGLGMRSFGQRGEGFVPFFHEIVAVRSDRTCTPPVVEEVVWPGLMLGQLLFSRAGTVVRGRPEDLDPRIAATSMLYFTFWRPTRRTADLSHGWGSSSQWRTAFRRDYDADGALIYNFDGALDLNAGLPPPQDGRPNDPDLSLEERIELLTNRCFVRCPKPDVDRWPWDDTLRQPRPAGAPA